MKDSARSEDELNLSNSSKIIRKVPCEVEHYVHFQKYSGQFSHYVRTTIFLLGAVIASTLMTVGLILTPGITEAAKTTSTPLQPTIQSDQSTLKIYDIVKDPQTGHTLLRFATGLANHGSGPLEIFGNRTVVDPNDNSMPAYQRIYLSDGSHQDSLVGKLVWYPQHGHFHFVDAVQYSLTDPVNGTTISSTKASFCLADSKKVDPSALNFVKTPKYNSCVNDKNALSVKMGISPGWQDIYPKDIFGQSFDVTSQMQQAAHNYILATTTNPDGVLIDTNHGVPQKTSIEVMLGQGVPVGTGISRPGV